MCRRDTDNLCSTCINQRFVRLANKYLFSIILPLFPPASPGFGCRCRGDGGSEPVGHAGLGPITGAMGTNRGRAILGMNYCSCLVNIWFLLFIFFSSALGPQGLIRSNKILNPHGILCGNTALLGRAGAGLHLIPPIFPGLPESAADFSHPLGLKTASVGLMKTSVL